MSAKPIEISGLDAEQPELTTRQRLACLESMLCSREIDRREGILYRQGRGWFHLPSAGHEAMAAAAPCFRADDYLFLYYRDRALQLARGAEPYEFALDFFGKRDSSSGGRQLAGFYSNARLQMVSFGAPTAMQCLPAAGCAWACKLNGQGQVVLCTIGDAAIRQGEYYEALCFATEKQLPIIFAVEDNGYGISTRTEGMNPYRLGVLASDLTVRVNGRDPDGVFRAFDRAAGKARAGRGPSVLWIETDRLHAHSGSDNHSIYRASTELALISERDPVTRALGGEAEPELRTERMRGAVREAYDAAWSADDPDPAEAELHVYSSQERKEAESGLPEQAEWTMAAAVTETLRDLLAKYERVMVFGQDVEDPKGGVFGLTKGLSSAFPGRVVNSPLAEATIAGAACGMALAGYRPIFELQFIDFSGPAFQQLAHQIATLRWRSAGAFRCPLVILAPCGGYLPAGGPWHSQTGEGWFAHAPGLQIVTPSDPEDAAALVRAACEGDDPVLVLLPKHQFRKRAPMEGGRRVRIGTAAIRREGTDATVVAWGNCVEIALDAANELRGECEVEVMDLRSIAPCDWAAIERSVRKTGRLVACQEDSRTCSFGQAIVAEMASRANVWRALRAAPELVSRPDTHIGFHPKWEAAVLPGAEDVCRAVRRTLRT